MRTVRLTKEVSEDILKNLLKRSTTNYGEFEAKVAEIVENVKENKDKALFDYTLKFDKFELSKDTILVSKEEIKEAYQQLDKDYIEVIKEAAANIADFHKRQLRNTWIETRPDGSILGQRITALESTGCYVPGGKAAYPSSVLMNIVPAKVAGVQRIVMVTPPSKEGKVNPGTIVAADIAGATEIYKVGGAQAIAALAYGTESIPKVDKITGPGNIYVALAKKAVFGNVGIDSIAGPSEIVVLADESANPRFVAADLLSQAEHDEMLH